MVADSSARSTRTRFLLAAAVAALLVALLVFDACTAEAQTVDQVVRSPAGGGT